MLGTHFGVLTLARPIYKIAAFIVRTCYEIFIQQAITFIRRDLMSMLQKNLCGNNICTAHGVLAVSFVGGGQGVTS